MNQQTVTSMFLLKQQSQQKFYAQDRNNKQKNSSYQQWAKGRYKTQQNKKESIKQDIKINKELIFQKQYLLFHDLLRNNEWTLYNKLLAFAICFIFVYMVVNSYIIIVINQNNLQYLNENQILLNVRGQIMYPMTYISLITSQIRNCQAVPAQCIYLTYYLSQYQVTYDDYCRSLDSFINNQLLSEFLS